MRLLARSLVLTYITRDGDTVVIRVNMDGTSLSIQDNHAADVSAVSTSSDGRPHED
jgi:hypothetical protein